MVEDIEKLKEDLKIVLSDSRYNHSISVMNMCEALASKYNVNVKKAKLVGLMHDMAKDMTKEEKIQYVKNNNIECSLIEEKIVEILHGKIAADICKKRYKFDEEMCTAIKYHTTGKENMTLLEKILFIADKIDETRNYEGVEDLRELAFEDLDKAILKNIDDTLIINIQKNKLILEESIKTRNNLLLSSEKDKNM